MTGFRPGIDSYAPDSATPNHILRARADAYNRTHETGAYAPQETRDGPQQARDNELRNLRLQLADAEKNLEGFANRHRDSKQAYKAYMLCHKRVRGLMETISNLTGEKFRFYVPLSDPFATNVDWVGGAK